ncbi:MAG: glycoside hydrolase family 13 protein [Clostridia bacterium]|nr:glycoside hydrolase family 13 protein [Clostridia bacterium]
MNAKYSITSKNAPRGCHAFPTGSEITVKLSVSGAECDKVFYYIGNDERVLIEREAAFSCYGSGFVSEYTVNTRELTEQDGLFFTHFEFVSGEKRYYIAFNGYSCSVEDRFVNETQILVYSEQYHCPEWLIGGAMYQIFPDRFSRGGEVLLRSNAVYREEWDNGIPEYPEHPGDEYPNNTHFGGTLYGVVERLSYLSSLGINCIYLNPIFEAYSNHKYDTADFLSVDKTFGGDAALAELIEKAHSVGIKVILDGVFNHVGNDSIYFDAYGKYGNGACSTQMSPYWEWFTFNDYPNAYESWWGIKNLPRINRCESYIRFITEKVIPKYMRMGIDGWRLDVADELEADFLDRVAAAIKRFKPDALIIGEVWEDASNKIAYNERKRYFRGKQLDSVTDYPLRNAIIEYVKNGDSSFFTETVSTLYRNYPPHKLACLMNFLGSHDTERIATVLCGDPDCGEEGSVLAYRKMSHEQRERAKELLKNAYLLMAFMPGIPCIYYGDEIAMEGYRDPFNRRPFPVSGFDDEYSKFFAEVNRIRREEKLFSSRELSVKELANGVVCAERIIGNERLIMWANMSNTQYNVSIPFSAVDIFNKKVYSNLVELSPKTVAVVKTEV